MSQSRRFRLTTRYKGERDAFKDLLIGAVVGLPGIKSGVTSLEFDFPTIAERKHAVGMLEALVYMDKQTDLWVRLDELHATPGT